MTADQTPSRHGSPSEHDEVNVHLSGEYDISNVGQLREALSEVIAAPVTHVVIDMTDVSFIDSSGLAELVSARNGLAEGRTIRVVNVRPNVKKAFDFTGLSGLFGITK